MERYLPDSGFAAGPNVAGSIPPASRNHLVPTGCGTPALIATAALLNPVEINVHLSGAPSPDQLQARQSKLLSFDQRFGFSKFRCAVDVEEKVDRRNRPFHLHRTERLYKSVQRSST